MREVEFRGKAVMDKDELDYQGIPNHEGWTFGSLIVDGNNYYIVGRIIEASDIGLIHEWWTEVFPESVGQYTGLTDKNQVEIFENDIGWDNHYEFYGIVKFDQCKFIYEWHNICEDLWEIHDTIEIVGNVHEHSHLLEGVDSNE